MPESLERPCLRRGLAAAPDVHDPRYVLVWDQYRLSEHKQRLSQLEFLCIQFFDGRRSLREVQLEAMRQAGGVFFPMEVLQAIVHRFEEAAFLEGPRWRELLSSPVRKPACLACYEADPQALRQQLEHLFTGPGGSGLPRDLAADGRLRAALLPHIDYYRGGATYTWGFKEIVEHSDASLFVIIATSHYSTHRFILTRKHFQTPLGVMTTDQAYVDRIVAHYGDGLFDDEAAHLPEHSIELEVVLLQYLYEKRRPVRIVPLLVGPFQDCVQSGLPPKAQPDIARMIAALQQAEAEAGEPVCYLISGDLAHVGPKFGDRHPVSEGTLRHSRSQDQVLLRHAERLEATRFFRAIADEGDRRRICGLPPIYLTLEATQPTRGQILQYDQYVHPHGNESVSFASMAFYR